MKYIASKYAIECINSLHFNELVRSFLRYCIDLGSSIELLKTHDIFKSLLRNANRKKQLKYDYKQTRWSAKHVGVFLVPWKRDLSSVYVYTVAYSGQLTF